MINTKKLEEIDFGGLRYDDPADSVFLDMIAEGMHPEGKEQFLKDLLRTPLERTSLIGPDETPLDYDSTMLLPPDDRKEYRDALDSLYIQDRPQREHGEPFSTYSKRIIDFAAQKALKEDSD